MYWILEPGHGGLAFGRYLTKGKQSPQVPPGIYEGEFNRAVCDYAHWCSNQSTVVLTPGPINIPLAIRAKYINELATKLDGDCALISVHANAMGNKGWNKAHGFAVFHSRTPLRESVQLAKLMNERLIGEGYSYSRGVKKANFSMITFGRKRILKVRMPAILVELGFMTHREEAELLSLDKTQRMFGRVLSDVMNRYEEIV